MEDLPRDLESELRAAHGRGEAEYGALPMEFDSYAERVLEKLRGRVGDDPEQLQLALRSATTTDLYLAIACDFKAPGSWEVLSRRFYPGLRSMALRAGASESEAEEIARALPGSLVAPPASGNSATRIAGYDAKGSLFSWLVSIAHRHYFDRLRAIKTTPEIQPIAPPTPSEAVVGAETGERVEAALRQAILDLTTRETVLLVWKYRDNLPQQEMAARLEVSEARVSQLVKRTVAKVRGGVLKHVPDESAPQWATREQLWAALRNVVGSLLDRQ